MAKDSKPTNQQRARWALVNACYKNGRFQDEEDFRDWLEQTFCTRKTSALSVYQTKILYLWLKHFVDGTPAPQYRDDWRITEKQQFRIQQVCDLNRITPAQLNGFIKRQTGSPKLVAALSKTEASKVITGLEKMYPKDNNYVGKTT
jgi:hypothetical protein